jgi:hypothetical protein
MRACIIVTYILLVNTILLTSCATHGAISLFGGGYSIFRKETDYNVLPYGSATLPGKWYKVKYNTLSCQQFFINQDSIIIALAFERYDNFEFNLNGSHSGYNFVKAFYDLDSKYFIDSHGLNGYVVESDSINGFMIYRFHGYIDGAEFDNWFLIGEKNGNISNFSISKTDKWTDDEKIIFLRNLFLTNSNK